jgi:hypothetical protein
LILYFFELVRSFSKILIRFSLWGRRTAGLLTEKKRIALRAVGYYSSSPWKGNILISPSTKT